MIVGTAGHVDHGKSALVEALTGQGMDRLAEERRRGLTIELNFAVLDLGAAQAGVVDVPGHEDLVRTMAAGASGMDVVLLVVAADEGIRPQTREHRAVLEALRVPYGIPVVTRADLAGPERAAAVAAEVAAWLAGSAVEFSAPVIVSARTGQGIAGLRDRLAARAVANHAGVGEADELFRLNVDRVFSAAGAGTIVTGSVIGGTVRRGDRVVLLPGGPRARVRRVERFGRATESAGRGDRIGLALALQHGEAARGQVLVSDGVPWRETRALDAVLELEPGTPEPAHGARVRVLAGTAERLARVRRRTDRPRIVRLALEAPLVVRGGERFVLRAYSPVETLGGGVVLDPSPPERGSWPRELDAVEPEARLRALVARRPEGIGLEEVPILLGCTPGAASRLVADAGLVMHAGRLLDPAAVVRAREAILAALAGAEPHGLAELRALPRQPRMTLGAALERLEGEGAISLRGGRARRGPWPEAVPPEVAALAARVEAAGLMPTGLGELGSGTSPARLREAELAGLVVRVDRERWLGAGAARRLHSMLRELAAAGEITPARLRERTGLSRKHLIPLLEWADRQGWTIRRGEARVAGPRLA